MADLFVGPREKQHLLRLTLVRRLYTGLQVDAFIAEAYWIATSGMIEAD